MAENNKFISNACNSIYKTIQNFKKQRITEHTSKNRKIVPIHNSKLSIRTNNTLSINTNIPYRPKKFKSIM